MVIRPIYSSVSAQTRTSTLVNALRRTESGVSAHFEDLIVGSSSGVDGEASSLSPQTRFGLAWGCMVSAQYVFSVERLYAVGCSAATQCYSAVAMIQNEEPDRKYPVEYPPDSHLRWYITPCGNTS